MSRKAPVHILEVGYQSTRKGIMEQINRLDDFVIHRFQIYANRRINDLSFDIVAYIDAARAYIQHHSIDGVFFDDDIGSIVAAVLCETYGFSGPSVDAAFRCYHKYFTRLHTRHAVAASLIDVSSLSPASLSYPCYIKAPCSSLGLLGYTLRDRHQLESLMSVFRAEIPRMNVPTKAFVGQYLDTPAYCDACRDAVLVEEILQGPQVTVEGYVHDGVVQLTVITDTNYISGTTLIDNFSFPSRLPPAVFQRIRLQTQTDVRDLGIDHSFFNIEYCLVKDRPVLIEVNCRAAICFARLYKQAIGYDVRRAGYTLCVGKSPRVSLKPSCVAGQFNIVTEATGIARELFDFTYPAPGFLNPVFGPDDLIQPLSEFGTVICQLELCGKSYEEIHRIADAYRQRALRR